VRFAHAAIALIAACFPSVVIAQDFNRQPAESAQQFAVRALQLPKDTSSPGVLETRWNGQKAIFVDYVSGNDLEYVALIEQPTGAYRKVAITTGEEEGGTAQIAAVGFANADRDAAQELVVILTWPVQHYDVEGTLYEVRIFDDVKPGDTQARFLKSVSDRFGANTCDCNRRDGKPERYQFKTIAKIKAELKRLGF